jgi:2'-5' RNA ligase
VTGDTARLFFAVWPAREVQHVLGEIARGAQRECGGRAVPTRNVHLTLVFLGNLPRECVTALERIASMMRGHRFALTVDRLEYWRHNRILWAGVTTCPDALQALVARLQDALARTEFRVDQRPYVPHVTLLRNARRAPAQDRCPEVVWPVDAFALVESAPHVGGRAYQVLRSWPLESSPY